MSANPDAARGGKTFFLGFSEVQYVNESQEEHTTTYATCRAACFIVRVCLCVCVPDSMRTSSVACDYTFSVVHIQVCP